MSDPEPAGATWSPEATSFAVSAPRADAVELALYDTGHAGAAHDAERRVPLALSDGGMWCGSVEGLLPGTRYGFRAHGPWAPDEGLLFDPAKLLVDPYARAVSGQLALDPSVDPGNPRESARAVPRSVVVDPTYDWQHDVRPGTSWSHTVIYELHVRGFTKLLEQVPEQLRGTYAGLAHPAVLDYLVDLGVTAVELLPVQHFLTEPAVARRGLTNYWGYNPIAFFAPHAGYASADTGQQVTEFKDMVRAFHAAGLEVLLDVVYNHTAEGPATGPTLSMRGLDDAGFYLRGEPGAASAYRDLTGCGNTVDTSYPPALRLVLESLRYWVSDMHVDGFRFDLASALARTDGEPDMASAFVTAVSQDPLLRDVKLVAEPWDASPEGYQAGRFPAPFREWNDRYRNGVRDFWRGRGSVRELADRLAGSPDVYGDEAPSPHGSVNFVTAHDGFTLRDLVSYERKHNQANLEGNRDGTDDHRSWNCGVEGETDDPEIVALRRRQAANLLLTLCLSSGVPLLTAGDERGRTQRGNNNPYVQDNEVSWLDWRDDVAWQDVYDVARAALALRREHVPARPDPTWLHPSGREMADEDWEDPTVSTLGMSLPGLVVWLHAGAGPVPLTPGEGFADARTVVLSTDPALPAGTELHAGQATVLGGRSVVVMAPLPRSD